MYGEDLDWAYALKQAGWQVRYNPAVTVLHVKRAASRQSHTTNSPAGAARSHNAPGTPKATPESIRAYPLRLIVVPGVGSGCASRSP